MKRLFVLLLCLFGVCAHAATNQLIVHEWGTFTSLQDENGRAIGGINSDDEPVPKFVHDLNRLLILKPDRSPPLAQWPGAAAGSRSFIPALKRKRRARLARSMIKRLAGSPGGT